jgi:putative ABC transport system permease protein
MSWLETLRTGVNGVRSHRMRSFLTVLGILIGIAGVIIAVGLGEGASSQVTSEINSLGSNVLTITPGSSTSSSGVRGALGSASTLTMADANALSSPVDAPDIKAVAAITSGTEVLTAGSQTATTSVQGTTVSWLAVRGRSLAEGRFIDNQDVKDHTAVGVLGATTASELFTRSDPVGQTVDVNGVPVTVVGVLASTGSGSTSSSSSSTGDPDDTLIVPITTGAERIFGGTSRNSLSSIAVQARSSADLTGAYQEADHLFLELHGITNPTNADFTITSEASLISANTSVDHTLTILLGGIAAISLIVGGIGVMNIMLVSVTERIREIGLRKALGATPRVIRRQFLVEASVLGLIGGAVGVVAGLVGVKYLPGLIGDPISTSPTAAVGALAIALAIGVLFGVYPASRAASLAPIDALRTE